MITGRRSKDWTNAPFSNNGEERRGQDRRDNDRRAPRRHIDPLFVATLVNHIAPAETAFPPAYAPAAAVPRRGALVNFRV